MTRDEILALPAGPDLDGLVDEAVFGLDRRANTPARIWRAIKGAQQSDDRDGSLVFVWAGVTYRVDARRVPDKSVDPHFKLPWVWYDRAGRPWQADLEAHVAAWRASPTRPWSSDIAAAWVVFERFSALRQLAIRQTEGWRRPGRLLWYVLDQSEYLFEEVSCGETAPLAICRAALLAVGASA